MLHDFKLNTTPAAIPSGGRSALCPPEAGTGRAAIPVAGPAIISCPCCGSSVERDAPLVDLNLNTISWRGSVTLSPLGADFAAALTLDFDRFVSVNTLITRVYGGSEPRWASAAVSRELQRIRAPLASIGLYVATRPGVGGYRLTPIIAETARNPSNGHAKEAA